MFGFFCALYLNNYGRLPKFLITKIELYFSVFDCFYMVFLEKINTQSEPVNYIRFNYKDVIAVWEFQVFFVGI